MLAHCPGFAILSEAIRHQRPGPSEQGAFYCLAAADPVAARAVGLQRVEAVGDLPVFARARLHARQQAGGGLAVAGAGHGFCVIVPGLVLRL